MAKRFKVSERWLQNLVPQKRESGSIEAMPMAALADLAGSAAMALGAARRWPIRGLTASEQIIDTAILLAGSRGQVGRMSMRARGIVRGLCHGK